MNPTLRQALADACPLLYSLGHSQRITDLDRELARTAFTQARAALDSTPGEPAPPTIIIDVSGGVVQSAVATEPIDAIFIDYDDDDNRSYAIPQSDGSTSNAWAGEAHCEVDPARVAQIVQALEEADAAAAQ